MSDTPQSRDFKLGVKFGRKEGYVINNFFQGLVSLSRSRRKIAWDDNNPFTNDLNNVSERFAKAHKALINNKTPVEHVDEFKTASTYAMTSQIKLIDLSLLVENLQANFKYFYADKSPYKKNLQVPENVNTQSELFSHLLKTNRGLALGDAHAKMNAVNLLKGNMQAARKAGVDTIYVEYPPEEFELISKMSIKELKNTLKTNDWDAIKKRNSEYYGVKNAESPKPYLEMLIAARENGIEIKNIDRRATGGDLVKAVDLRIASTNFEWAHNIERDRKGKTGKFIVFCGEMHFANGKGPSNGLVDDALGIPHITFAYSPHDDGKFRKSDRDGEDFALNGGPKFVQVEKSGKILRSNDHIELASVRPSSLPGKPQHHAK